MPDYSPIMKLMCQAHGIPEPEPEYRFHPTRKWRVDFAWNDLDRPDLGKVALEIEGGAWTGGRHTRGSGFIKDMLKYNELQLAGFILLRCTPQQLKNFDIAPLIKRALGMNNDIT